MTNLTNRPIVQGRPKDYCVCGCGLHGAPRQKVWRGEMVGHVSRCACPRCTGGRVKARARTRENKLAKDTGGVRAYASGVISGWDVATDLIEMEETADKALVRGLFSWWESKQIQRKMGRLLSRNLRPIAFVASRDGKHQLVAMPYESFLALLQLAQRPRLAAEDKPCPGCNDQGVVHNHQGDILGPCTCSADTKSLWPLFEVRNISDKP